MEQKYTIESALPTGKSDPKFGTEFHVKFHENEGTFKLWYKNTPTEGQEQEGTIDGWKFKKAKKEWNPTQTQTAPTASAPSATTYRKDNSDGIRKGMSINNAAAYVTATADKPLPPKEWAKLVSEYGLELFKVSDLEDTTEDLNNVKDAFGL